MVSYDAVHIKVIQIKEICVSVVWNGKKTELLKSVIVKNKNTAKKFDDRTL